MGSGLKKRLYFLAASYFRFFAGLKLRRWHPVVIVVTGSSGKTTLLHLLESQLGTKARYSHHANSAIGIPFDILGIRRKTLELSEWPKIILTVPFMAFTATPVTKIYIVEADCDRPGEGKFLAEFLRPDYVLWLNATRTHSMNFVPQVAAGLFKSVEEAVAFEFGYFLEYTRKCAWVNADLPQMVLQFNRCRSGLVRITRQEYLSDYSIDISGTMFNLNGVKYILPYLLPEESFYALSFTVEILKILNRQVDTSFVNLNLPPGRNSVLPGIKNTTIIDSSYNANLSSMTAILSMVGKLKARHKWLIIGDMLEQGAVEKEEHEKLAALIQAAGAAKVILYGDRVRQFTYPVLKKILSKQSEIILADTPGGVLKYIRNNLGGGETLLFKGGRLLEGVIGHLLENPTDAVYLCRRESFWEKRRRAAGL